MFRGMEYVYEVYKEKSFSKAARNLYISQPSLSAAVKKVEQQVGCEIFDRSTTPIQLTECGEVYIESVKKVMEIEESFDNFKSDLEELKRGSISIGGTTFFTSFILPPIIQRFSEKYPCISINLVETNTGQLEKELFEGQIDLVIDNYCFDSMIYESHFFAKEQLVLAVPVKYLKQDSAESKHIRMESNTIIEETDTEKTDIEGTNIKEANIKETDTGEAGIQETNARETDTRESDVDVGQKVAAAWLSAEDIRSGKHLGEEVKPVSLERFKKMPFLFLKEGNDTRIRADKICVHSHFKPKIILMLDQQLTAYNLTCQGMGISFISDTLVKSEKPDPRVVYYRLDHQDSSRNVNFYYKRTRYMKRAVREFLKIADEIRCSRWS